MTVAFLLIRSAILPTGTFIQSSTIRANIRKEMSRSTTKQTIWHVRPAKTDEPVHPPSLIWVFAVRSLGCYGPTLSSCGEQRLCSDWADAQADLHCVDISVLIKLRCLHDVAVYFIHFTNWTASSEFVSSSIPSWQILTAHAQSFRGARDLAFCLKVPLDSLLVWASSGGSGETARMRRLAWTFAARIGDKYQIRLTRSNWFHVKIYNRV